ncbi:REP-associated tyrosine transposase [Sedimenticola hydrogenitrophicus]|uniref:REP-associated tyrosine transposase n=1 Tax=Sedimenticola hydrogenitrophicus TaxID=2967975 RepID=UPI0023B128ED|nr:transposase [Sedimenticola hydrogenitrophicus]
MPNNRRAAHGRNLRRGRRSERGRAYLITTVTRDRAPRFMSMGHARAVVMAMRQAEAEGMCETLAWVLMPDHLHWLFVLRDGDLSVVVAKVKQVSAREINSLERRRGASVWQRGFYDRAVRREEDIAAMARYMVANPLRAGLVQRVGDYPYWDAAWL